MARRRKADAPAADAALETANNAISDIISDVNSDVVPTDTNADANPPNADVSPTLSDAPEPTETPKAAPRRRAAPRRKAPAAEETPAEPLGVTEELSLPFADTPPAETVAEPLRAEPVSPRPAPTPRRTRRGKAAESDAPTRDEATAILAGLTEGLTAEAVEVEVTGQQRLATPLTPTAPDAEIPFGTPIPAALADSPEKTGRSRRRSRNKGPGAGQTAVEQAAPTEMPEAETPTTVTGSETRRLRGQRRPRPAGPTLIVAPTMTETVAAPAEMTGKAAGETEQADAAKPKRTRGLRKAVKPAPVVVAASPATLAVEPIAPIAPIYQPLAPEILARLAETKIVVQNGVPELIVNGEPRLPVWFFVNTEDSETLDTAVAQVRLAYEAGIRFFSVLAHLPWKTRTGERRFEPLDDALQIISDNAPDAFILPRLLFSPLNSWIRTHEDDMTLYSDDETGDVSLASKAFWEDEADAALRAAVERVAQGPHAGKVFGFYLEHGEWFYEKGRGYDRSLANVAGFRTWLKAKYRNSVIALRSAWFDGGVTFEAAEIPDWPAPAGTHLFFGDRERRYADYHKYASDRIARVIDGLGKSVKEASGGRSAVAVSYGYTLELMRPNSGHLSLAQLLASPNVDILTGPISYAGRLPGGSAPLPAPVDSVHLAGKLWVSEDDTKTYLAADGDDETPDAYNPKIDTLEGVWAAHSRNFGAALAQGAGISFMDLWGRGWLADREIWQNIARLRSVGERLAQLRRAAGKPVPEPDVAVFVDERSFFGVRADDGLLEELIAKQRDTLRRSGARIGFYLLSDSLKPNFPQTPRLFLFLNAFRLPDAIRAALKARWQNDGRTLAWLYGPGALEDSVTEVGDAIGMTLQLQPWGSKTGTQISSSARSPLTDALRGQIMGDEVRLNPTYYVSDPKAEILGEYVQSGNPSLAVRKHPRWQSVFIGERSLPLPLLRGLYRLAGVPTFTVDDDAAFVGENFVLLHSAPGGGTTVNLPTNGAIGDALTGEALAADGYGARLSMPVRGTRLLLFGAPEMLANFGIDARYALHGLTESELPPPPIPFDFEETDDFTVPRRADVPAEDAELFEAALSGDLPVPDKDKGETTESASDVAPAALTATAAETEEAKKKRRRRRRRGRGKAGMETDSEETLGDNTGDADEEETGEAVDDTAEIVLVPAEPEMLPVVEAPPPVRTRPSLEELLPFSEALIDSVTEDDLPPIPDEFLPLAPDALFAANGDAPEEKPARRPRRRRAPAAETAVVDKSEDETEGASENPGMT